ncbi:MAG: hypothetical protein ACJ8CR_05885 [Roseiflexaceae bacterium]
MFELCDDSGLLGGLAPSTIEIRQALKHSIAVLEPGPGKRGPHDRLGAGVVLGRVVEQPVVVSPADIAPTLVRQRILYCCSRV